MKILTLVLILNILLDGKLWANSVFLKNFIEEVESINDQIMKFHDLSENKSLQRFKRFITNDEVIQPPIDLINGILIEPAFNTQNLFDIFNILPSFIKDVFVFDENDSKGSFKLINKVVQIEKINDLCQKYNNNSFIQIEIVNSQLNCSSILYEIEVEKICKLKKNKNITCDDIAMSLKKQTDHYEFDFNSTIHQQTNNLSKIHTLDTKLISNTNYSSNLNDSRMIRSNISIENSDVEKKMTNITRKLLRTSKINLNNLTNQNKNIKTTKYKKSLNSHNLNRNKPLIVEYDRKLNNCNPTINNWKNLKKDQKNYEHLFIFNKNSFSSFIWGVYGSAVFLLLYKLIKLLYALFTRNKSEKKFVISKQKNNHLVDVTHLVEYLNDSDDESIKHNHIK